MTDTPDPSKCPLCGQPNACGHCDSTTAAQPCWCFSVAIAPDVQRRIPDEAQGKACICARCARGE
ncbi:cysteine-rich CWC family protein [Pseudomonas knackmussii]|uniref:Cysteine-rich CWC family protein n=1 Tax=Pseudomonas knackmussii TaxID=65741 RepID=A0ABY4KTW7_9PSED|nr:cysteine-rich CWC family protein [Pseudomonas knackmussii]UPQ83895.1 cysteine-rich CWC family protein [Pseudomonas knackmussii]